MNVSILVCTYGSQEWAELAERHAVPSTVDQGAHQVIVDHDSEMYLDEIRNSAAEQATGDYLCFLDADDTLAPNYLSAMHEYWLRSRPGSLLVPQVQYHRDGTPVGKPFFPNRERPIDEMNHCVIGTLIPRLLFEQVGGFGTEVLYEDWALFLRCVRAGAELVYVEGAIYNAHMSDTGRNSSAPYTLQRAVYNQIRQAHLDAA